MIKEITTYIEDNVAGLTIDTNLFAGFRPADAPDDCTTVQETGPGKSNFYLPDFVEKTVQVVTRGKTYFTTRDAALAVYVFLHGKAGISLPVVTTGVLYHAGTIEAIQVPQYIGQDENGLFEFSTNYIFRIQDGTA
jgi:hypothetical protein